MDVISMMMYLRDVFQFVDIVVGTFTDEDGTPYIGWGEDQDGDGELSPYEVMHKFIQTEAQTETEKSIIIVSPDGTMTIYDENGEITEDDCDTAYTLWLSENAALDKDFEHYSVTEALLFLIFVCAAVGLVSKIFKRRLY